METHSYVYQVEPLIGVGQVKLGMPRERVRELLGGDPHTSGSRRQVDNYHDGGFQVFYDEAGNVEFIELARDADLVAMISGIDVFGTPAHEVLDAITQFSAYNPDDPEVGYSYVFHDIELSLWRPNIPEEAEGEGRYFSTIGIGVRGYYSETVKE